MIHDINPSFPGSTGNIRCHDFHSLFEVNTLWVLNYPNSVIHMQRIYMQRKQISAEGPGTHKMQMKRNHKTYPRFSREMILWVQSGNVLVVEILCLREIINAWWIREIFQWNYQNLSWIWILVVLDMDFRVLRLWETWLNTFTFCHFDLHFLLKIINYHRSFMKKSQISDLNSSKE